MTLGPLSPWSCIPTRTGDSALQAALTLSFFSLERPQTSTSSPEHRSSHPRTRGSPEAEAGKRRHASCGPPSQGGRGGALLQGPRTLLYHGLWGSHSMPWAGRVTALPSGSKCRNARQGLGLAGSRRRAAFRVVSCGLATPVSSSPGLARPDPGS